MKQFFTLLLSMSVILCLTACGTPAASVPAEQSMEINSADETTEAQKEVEETTEETADIAVVYFSGTGNTKKAAQLIQAALNADIYEIEPVEPYTTEDLNYNDDNCRANQEMKDDTARPAIANDLSNVLAYDTVYIGYPIWWGTAPRIIQTFLDNYDISGKNIYTFCTSGGSGIEQSISDLQKLYPQITIQDGRRFGSSATADEVDAWLKNNEN